MINKENHLPNIVFMGPPGVGKGTVAALLAKNNNMIHLSTGAIFREEIASQSELGKQLASYVNNGLYVPDEITNETVKVKVLKLLAQNQNIILDGYPRTLDQVHFLNSISGFKYEVVELTAPEDVIMERLNGRRFCPNCKASFHIKFMPSKNGDYCDNCGTLLIMRKDDSIENIKVRQQIYQEQTAPLLDYYREHHTLHVFDANTEPEIIEAQIVKELFK
ncbi:adenylate kinase family protein [Mycoplasmopsis gallinarum]|uniref:adenylate kinase family protein n=1 Tax=Mycoplasmopsis gallinarum TaxID=29557 RepID=UPI00048775FD|nr:nucleoside monophosphate kinase [Mycoplasmopsis gallinarum]